MTPKKVPVMAKPSPPEKIRFGVKSKKLWKDIRQDKLLYLMMLLPIAIYILFIYKPMLGLQIAFKDYNVFQGIEDSPWIGFENFKTYFTSPFFTRTLKNTIMLSLYNMIFSFPAPIILALMFNEVRNTNLKKFVQTCTYIPHFISVVIVASLVTSFLSPTSGIINTLISAFGGEKVYFLTKPEYFRAIYTIMGIWQGTGFNSIVYLSVITAIDSSLYEAAMLDGANKWNQITHVTLPSILPTIVMMFIMRLGNTLNVGYESILLLYQPSTYETADTIGTYVYRIGLENSQYSLATAVGLVNGIVGLILVVLSNKLSKHVTEYGLW